MLATPTSSGSASDSRRRRRLRPAPRQGGIGISRASLKIVNRTRWSTEHLRAFVVAARAEVFGDHIQGKKLKVTFVTSRRQGVSGLASVGGGWSRIRIPKQNIDKR